ncbi:hypothetical protein BEWA_015690 [Theileria equi strain WA]|uniref:Signal peptide containing protein n=1 Tax=Theileria equi strain WA TaxID=1537102 RepID=L1LCV8_THEEQ|nr:hypothetical protein BEWA_015690 [Theileria equi strain WA]EKX73008.1 hypothetical protein BEWA_015690 [Theileria equi strain WA]|eukprot:XP_004832460.1 hypothetical protein BEWA_015690 [Theileria equi strain WA]
MRSIVALYTVVLCICCSLGSCGSNCISQATLLDLESPNDSLCKSFETSIDGVPSKVYTIKPGTDVQRVVYGEKAVWNSEYGVKCTYCVVFTKDKEPRIVLIKTQEVNGSFQRFYWYKASKRWYEYLDCCGCIFKPAGWSKSGEKYKTTMNEIRMTLVPVAQFSLDIGSKKEGDNFKIRSYEKDGVSYRYYTAKDGYQAKKVVDGNTEIWEAGTDQTCYLCELCRVDGELILRIHIKKQDYKALIKCYEKSGSGWSDIDNNTFNTRLEGGEITDVVTPTGHLRRTPNANPTYTEDEDYDDEEEVHMKMT